MKRLLFSGALALILAISVAEVLRAQRQRLFKIVVHPGNPVRYVSGGELSDLFLKKRTRWGDGTPVQPVDLESGSAVRQEFSEIIHGRSIDRIEQYWQRQIFSGREVPPLVVAGDDEVLAFVRERPGGIGYVSTGARVDDLRVVGILRPPVAVSKTAPTYTTAARRANGRGVVVLRVHVDETGEVGQIEVIDGLRYGLTDRAIAAVRQWEFRPANLDGEPVAETIDISVKFELE